MNEPQSLWLLLLKNSFNNLSHELNCNYLWCVFTLILCFSLKPEVSILVGVTLRSFPIRAVHTVGGSADPTHLAQRKVICPALMLSR